MKTLSSRKLAILQLTLPQGYHSDYYLDVIDLERLGGMLESLHNPNQLQPTHLRA